jgi:fermentation-respiration switch protein FrsA (DUF1100 family)
MTRSRRIWKFIRRRLITYPLLYCGVVLVLLLIERHLVFVPSSANEAWLAPVDPKSRDVWFEDAHGTKLHGWWSPPDDPANGAVLFSHGNGGNITHRGAFAANLRRILGAGVLLYDYPGYGKSEGRPDEAGCYASGDAAYQWLVKDGGIDPKRIVLLGESLGGGVAVELATRHEHRALALFYTFTSLPKAAKHRFPWLPTVWLMRTRFENLDKIGRCRRPVFITHGTSDAIIPFAQGEELFAAANEPKEFFRMEGGTHNMPMDDGVLNALAAFLNKNAP